jgi:hypothetical protein
LDRAVPTDGLLTGGVHLRFQRPKAASDEGSRCGCGRRGQSRLRFGISDDLAEKLQKIIAKLYEKLRSIAEDLKADNEVSFTITVGVPLGVSLTVKPLA